jgi:hypothetical protein
MITVLSDRGRFDVEGRASGDDLWVGTGDLERATGWQHKPEGLCQGDVCVPIPPSLAADLLADGEVNVATFWRHLGQPVVHTGDGGHWYLGEGAATRREQLESLRAPDFTLPDVDGNAHSLSDYRGKIVLLATWASW